jgi:hypothetical protein
MGGGVALHERLRGGDGGNTIPLTRPFRRGRKFGTILVDLDVHQVVDVLAERSRESSADWMRDHPEIAYVSRDRGKDYTQGANEGHRKRRKSQTVFTS